MLFFFYFRKLSYLEHFFKKPNSVNFGKIKKILIFFFTVAHGNRDRGIGIAIGLI